MIHTVLYNFNNTNNVDQYQLILSASYIHYSLVINVFYLISIISIHIDLHKSFIKRSQQRLPY